MVDTAEERALDIYRVPARRLGAALLEVRRQRGLTRRHVEQSCGGRPSLTRLRAIERGRRRITPDELEALVRVYGVETSSLMPGRRRFSVDLERGVLFFNGEEHPLAEDLSPGAVLAQYLALVVAARRASPTPNAAAITLRSTDLRVLGTAFGTTRAALRNQLADAMGTRVEVGADHGSVTEPQPEPQPEPRIEAGPESALEIAVDPEPALEIAADVHGAAEAEPIVAPPADAPALAGLDDADALAEIPEAEAQPSELFVQEIERPTSTSLAVPEPERTREVMVYGDGPRPLDAGVVNELEDIYDALSVRSTSWLPRAKRRNAERRVELVAKESALLEELGYESWSAMLIGIALGEASLPYDEISIPTELVDEYLGAHGSDTIGDHDPLALRTIEVLVPSPAGPPSAPAPAPTPSPSVSTSGSTSWQQFAHHRVSDIEAPPESPTGQVGEPGSDEPDWLTAPFDDEDLSRFETFDSLPSFVEFGQRLDAGVAEDSDLGNGTVPGR